MHMFRLLHLLRNVHVYGMFYKRNKGEICKRGVKISNYIEHRRMLIIVKLVKKLPALYGTWRPVTLFTRTLPGYVLKIPFNIIIHPRFFSSGFSTNILCAFIFFFSLRYIKIFKVSETKSKIKWSSYDSRSRHDYRIQSTDKVNFGENYMNTFN